MVDPLSADGEAVNSLTALIHQVALSTEAPLSAQDLSNKQVSSYIRSLSNFSLTELRQQPNQLQSKSEALHQQLSELCISQTDAFIHIHQAEQQFAPSLSGLSTHLEHLINDTLPQLQDAADAFLAASKPVLEERHVVHNIADQYEKGNLSDLLEISPLVYTCVKAGHHSEAIQLTEHLIGLLKRSQDADFKPDGPAEQGQRNTYLSLLIETLSHLAIIKSDLISSFSKVGLKLPAARKSVSVLRRLSSVRAQLPQIPDWANVLASQHARSLLPELALTENQLCLAFLKARTRSFHTALDSMGSPSSFSSEAYLRRYVDLWRHEMTDTLAMAFPLFVDDSSQGANGDQDMVTPAYLISSFATSALHRLRDTVSAQLLAASQRVQSSTEPSAALETLAETYSNLHTQLSYASAALSRFGFDFGKLLFAPSPHSSDAHAPLSTMETAWLDALSLSLDSAFSPLHDQLDQHTTSLGPSPSPSSWLLSTKLSSGSLQELYTLSSTNADDSSAAYADYSRPNIELVDYPPIATLLNRILSTFNALQLFAPLSLGLPLLRRLDAHFARLTGRLLADVPEVISHLQAEDALTDDDAVQLLQHLDADAKKALQTEVVRDRETVILSKVLKIYQASVVHWTMHVVRTQIFDLPNTIEEEMQAETAWSEVQDWMGSNMLRIAEASKQRKEEADERRIKVEAAAAKKAKEEQEAREKAEEEARVKAEAEAKAKAEEEARVKAEEEARRQAEEEARLKAEAEAKAKADEEARLQAEEQARLEAEEEARLKAEAEAEAEEESRLKAEAEAKVKAEEEARLKAEDEARQKAEAQAKAKAEEEAKIQAETEAKAKAEEEARLKAEEARLKAEEDNRLKAEAEAAKKRAEEEDAATKQAEEAAKAKAEAEAPIAEQPKVQDQPAVNASPKKFSLAEKLRQRKEERDRAAAAAAAAATATNDASEDQDTEKASTGVEEKQDGSTTTATTQDSLSSTHPKIDEGEEQAQTEGKGQTAKDVAGAAEDGKKEDEDDDVEAGDDGEGDSEEASGANTPVTPTTPNPGSGGGGGGAAKKKNKKKKK